MASEGTRHLFVLSFPEAAQATQAVDELHELSRDMFIKLGDWAVITKGDDGALTVTENPTSDPNAKRGALTGGIGMGLVALAGPIGIGAIAVGAGIGAVAGALMDSGFKSKDLDEVGGLMESGRSVLLVTVTSDEAVRIRSVLDDIPALSAADRRAEFEIDADSKNVLRDALAAHKADPAAGSGTAARGAS